MDMKVINADRMVYFDREIADTDPVGRQTNFLTD
jgi:hypothetical protein